MNTILYNNNFPRSNQYPSEWILDKSMGINALWLTEWLCEDMNLKSGMKVLDLGCGKAISSIFLTKEYGVQVWAYDLWIKPTENWETIKEQGCEDSIFPMYGDARQLPFAEGFFDAIISIDAYIYFGTDDLYLNYLQKYLTPKGKIGIVVPGLMNEFDGNVPEHLMDFWGQDCWSWHTIKWWEKLWERTKLVNITKADILQNGWKHYLFWKEAQEKAGKNRWLSDIETLKNDKGEYIGFMKLIAEKNNYTKINSKTWDKWVENKIEWSLPITHEEFENAKKGKWGVYLTPTKFVPKEWFLPFKGSKLLGLASGGGQQMPIFSALGAQCTVLDYSEEQLEKEKMVSKRDGYKIDILKGDMTKRLPFEDESFDMIFHPVSNCYIENVYHVWNECYRVLKKGGVLLAGMDNGMNFLIDDEHDTLPLTVVNKLPFNPLKMSDEIFNDMAENYEGIQFSHSLEEQIGGQLKAGFILKDLYEDRDREGCGLLREYTPQYFATRAVKK